MGESDGYSFPYNLFFLHNLWSKALCGVTEEERLIAACPAVPSYTEESPQDVVIALAGSEVHCAHSSRPDTALEQYLERHSSAWLQMFAYA